MKLRFNADKRTLVWAYVLFPLATLLPFACPKTLGWALPVVLYVGLCSGVFAHNHNHSPVFESRVANTFHSAWLSVFYGYPTFAWIPTHNRNHHKFVNREGDASITWRWSSRNTWLVASTYFFVCAYWQTQLTRSFLRRAKEHGSPLYRRAVTERVVVTGVHLTLVLLAVRLYGWRLGPVVYLGTFGASAAMGLWGTMFFNFIQHVHCDSLSPYDHSRNFVSKVGNFLLFNNGFHTAHHEHPGAHWSRLPSLHEAIAPRIHPELCQSSIFAFCLKCYVLAPLLPRYGTRPMGCPEGRSLGAVAPKVAIG